MTNEVLTFKTGNMKQLFKFDFLAKLFLLILAVFTGGGYAMAVEVGDIGSDTDPNEGKPLEGATPDAIGKGIDQQGGAGTGSAITQAELAENKIEDYVSKFQAFKYPMHTDFIRMAKQVPVKTKEPDHYVIGEAIMDCEVKSKLTNSTDKNESVVLPLYKNDQKLFVENATILVDGVTGYDEKGVADGTPLVLIVDSILFQPSTGR